MHDKIIGFTNRVLWPILHYRVDLAEFSRRDLTGYLRVNDHFARELHKVLRPDDFIWVHDLSPDAARQGTARAWAQESHRLFPSHPIPAAGNADAIAAPRAPQHWADRFLTALERKPTASSRLEQTPLVGP
jgi:Glycosyltransferase family 20